MVWGHIRWGRAILDGAGVATGRERLDGREPVPAAWGNRKSGFRGHRKSGQGT